MPRRRSPSNFLLNTFSPKSRNRKEQQRGLLEADDKLLQGLEEDVMQSLPTCQNGQYGMYYKSKLYDSTQDKINQTRGGMFPTKSHSSQNTLSERTYPSSSNSLSSLASSGSRVRFVTQHNKDYEGETYHHHQVDLAVQARIRRMERKIRKLTKTNELLGDQLIDYEDRLDEKVQHEQAMQDELVTLFNNVKYLIEKNEKKNEQPYTSSSYLQSHPPHHQVDSSWSIGLDIDSPTSSEASYEEEQQPPPQKQQPIVVAPRRRGNLKKGMSFRTVMKTVYQPTDEEKIGAVDVNSDKMMAKRHSTVTKKAYQAFPGLITSDLLVQKVEVVLTDNIVGYDNETTLLATSLCCDEVNREFEDSLRGIFGYNFSMGGLAGFAFGGVTSFGAMAHHIPINGNALIVYGPHVGIDYDGNVGKLNRVGRHTVSSGACCGSAAAAHAYCQMVSSGERTNEQVSHDDFVDAQQVWVGESLLPYTERLQQAKVPEVELPHALFDCQDDLMQRILQKGCGEVGGNGKIALLGGIQVNTPNGISEYFVPKKFELYDNKGNRLLDLMDDLKAA